MTPKDLPEAFIEASGRRVQFHPIARYAAPLLILLVTAAVLFVCLTDVGSGKTRKPKPLAHMSFYNHVDVCKSTLRGYSSDDDIHAWGVATGASSFGGWTSWGHYSDGSVWTWGRFNYSGYYKLYKGRCYGGDYASDWFEG